MTGIGSHLDASDGLRANGIVGPSATVCQALSCSSVLPDLCGPHCTG